MLSVKQEDIKYHFLSLLYNSTWDWTPVTQAIGEYSNHYAIGEHTHHYATGPVNRLL